MNKNHIKNIVFVIIVIIIIWLRTINFPNSIKEMNCDEIMTVVNSVSILETGNDITGIKYPVYLLGWGGQSVVLLYLMVLSIKVFGYSLFAIRIPLLVVSLLSSLVFFDFTRRITKNKTIAKISLIAVLISPWHILQSLWALDCNMFPHFLLISIYLCYIAIEKNKKILLYISVICFAITLYCYGIAIYFVPLFLTILMLYLLKLNKISLKQVIICFFTFTTIALPIVITFAINVLKIEKSIEFCNITMPYYTYLTRTNDILFFSENIFTNLISNTITTFKIIFLQFDNCVWNSSIYFGTIYHISLIFIVIAIVDIIKQIKHKKINLGFFIIIEWILVSILTGIIINSTNINRLNSIWYPLIFLTVYGIYILWNKIKHKKIYTTIISITYLFLFILYILFFNLSYSEQISSSGCFSRGFISALNYTDTLEQNNVIYTNFEGDGCLPLYCNWQNTKHNKIYKCINNQNDLSNNINTIDNNTVIIMKTNEFELLNISYDLQITRFGEYVIINN